MSRPSSDAPPFRVLLVCTGNICRSAMAERLGRAFVDQVLGEDADVLEIVSAGTRAVVGSTMHPDSALALRGYGAEAGDFRARQLVDGMADDADLTLTMTRAHRDLVLRGSPRAMARTFTLREAADLVGRLGDGAYDGSRLTDRARALVRAMADERSQRQGGSADDVRDPIGQPLEVHDEVCGLIVDGLLPVLRGIVDLSVEDRVRA